MAKNGSFGPEDVEVVKRELLFQGFYRMEKLSFRHRMFAGGWSPLIQRELFVRPPAAGVLAYDPARDEVLLIEQCRVGALDDPHIWQLEIVAGLIDEGEDGEAVVRREAQEEAGVELDEVEYVMTFLTSAGGTNERYSLYVARADLGHAGGVHGLPEEGEDIRVCVMGVDQAAQALSAGHINNAQAIIAVQWLLANRERLRRKWGS